MAWTPTQVCDLYLITELKNVLVLTKIDLVGTTLVQTSALEKSAHFKKYFLFYLRFVGSFSDQIESESVSYPVYTHDL